MKEQVYVYRYDTTIFEKEWSKLINYIKEALKIMDEYIKEINSNKSLKPSIEDKLLLVIDIITWILKSPAFIDSLENTLVSPYKIYWYERLYELEKYREKGLKSFFDLLKTCEPSKIISSEPALSTCKFIKRILKLANDIQKYYSEEISVENKKVLRWRYVLGYPADTRPGYNSVSLLVHLLLVSGIAWALAIERKKSKKDALIYALAGLLHDIGKPLDPRRHVEKSVEVVEKELGGILRELIGEECYRELIKLIKRHHEEPLIKRADGLAAKERNTLLVSLVLGNDITGIARKIKDKAREQGLRNLEEFANRVISEPTLPYIGDKRELLWRFWELVDEEDYKKLTRKYAENTWGLKYQELLKKTKEVKEFVKEIPENIGVILVDIRRIQELINRSLDLGIMAITSYLIDTWLFSYLPTILSKEYFMPLTTFIIHSGGKALIVAPLSQLNNIKESIKRHALFKDTLLRLDITITHKNFDPDYHRLITELEDHALIKKRLDNRERIVHLGLSDKCDLCGTRPASIAITIADEERRVCIECAVRWALAREVFYHRYKLETYIDNNFAYDIILPKELCQIPSTSAKQGNKKAQILKYIMEYIAGLPPIPQLHGRILNYSVVSVDGNFMGLYMYLSPTYTAAVEKSLLIDYALKRSYRSFIEKVIDTIKSLTKDENAAYREALRLYLGLIYMGGDDAKIIAPTHLVPALVIHLAREFHKILGCTATLSFGIASAPPKHHIWGLNDTSIGLEFMAKEGGRKFTLEALSGNKPSYIASLQIYHTDSTSMLTRDRVIEFIGNLCSEEKQDICVKEGLMYKYMYISSDGSVEEYLDLSSFYKMLLKLVYGEKYKYTDIVDELIKLGYLLTISQCNEVAGSNLASCIEYYIGKTSTDGEEILKEAERLRGSVKDFYRILKELLQVYNRYRDTVSPLSAVLLYAKRQSVRERVEKRKVYKLLSELLSKIILDRSRLTSGTGKLDHIRCSFPIFNYMFLLKLLSGGVV